MKSFQWGQTDSKVVQIWTRTSVQTTCDHITSPSGGFTFLELMVVIALAALLVGYVVPNFFGFFTSPQDREFNHLSKVLRIMRTDAVLRNRSYCLSFDLIDQLMYPGFDESGKCMGMQRQEEDWPKWLKEHDYPEELVLKEARFASKMPGMAPPEVFEARIDSSGFVTPFLLIFAEREGFRFWEMESKGLLGKLEMQEF